MPQMPNAAQNLTYHAETVQRIHHKRALFDIFNGSADSGGTTEEINFHRLKAVSHSDLFTEYIDNVTITDFEEAVKTLAEDGCTRASPR